MRQPAIFDVPLEFLSEQFKEFCADIFGGLYRVDQRRAAEAYLHGLLSYPGRKSVRRVAIASGHHSEQSLQKFVNQSTWDYEPIRHRVLDHLVARLTPLAWVIEEVAFPKHGRLSAAVERQYVRSLKKVCNCQLAVTVTLTTDRFSVPVNWRLLVPGSWGKDDERRVRARMPPHECPRPYWHYQIELIDDMALDWGMVPAPVVVDLRQNSTAEALLIALEERGLPYLVQIGERLPLRYERRTSGRAAGWSGPEPAVWQGPAGELARRATAVCRRTVGWDADEVLRSSRFLQVPVRSAAPDGDRARAVGRTEQRRLVIDWPLDKPGPCGLWITNIDGRPLEDLVALAHLRRQAFPQIELLAEQFGLRDYEGRTFIGWHHHVTLAAAAYAFRVLCLLGAAESDETGESDEVTRTVDWTVDWVAVDAAYHPTKIYFGERASICHYQA